VPQEHLIPLRKTVTRAGVSFEQTFWVRARDLQAKVKGAVKEASKMDSFAFAKSPAREQFNSAVADLGGNPALTDKWLGAGIGGWGGSSTSPEALELRGAACALAGQSAEERAALQQEDVDDAIGARGIKEWTPRFGSADDPSLQEMIAKSRAAVAAEKERVRATHAAGVTPEAARSLSALAALSQAAHPEEEVVLYRGVHGEQAKQIREAAAKGEPFSVEVGIVSSFSESEAQAKKFARGGGVVVKQVVPRSSIVLSARALPHLSVKNIVGKKEVAILTKGAMTIDPKDVALL